MTLSKIESKRCQPYANLLAGDVGCLAGLVVRHPLDTVKVRLQTMQVRARVQCKVLLSEAQVVPAMAKRLKIVSWCLVVSSSTRQRDNLLEGVYIFLI